MGWDQRVPITMDHRIGARQRDRERRAAPDPRTYAVRLRQDPWRHSYARASWALVGVWPCGCAAKPYVASN